MNTYLRTSPLMVYPEQFHDLIGRIAGEMESMAHWLGQPSGAGSPQRVPADIMESDEAYHVRFELPGFRRDDVSLRLDGEVLGVTATRAEGDLLPATTVARSLNLPGPVDGNAISARMEDGVLTVTLARHEQTKARTIPID